MKKFYEAITKVRNSGIDMTSGEMIMREMKALVGDSCNLECRWLKCALKRNMQMEFVGKEQKTLKEKNQIVGKVRKQLTLEEKLNDIAVDVTIIALMLLANWKEDYYNDFDISYIDTAGATDSKITFESESLKTEEENPLNEKVNINENTKNSKKEIFDIEQKKKSFSNRAPKPLDATVDIIKESDGGRIRKIVIPLVGGIICLVLVFSIGKMILGRENKMASNDSVTEETSKTTEKTTTSTDSGADSIEISSLDPIQEETTDKLSLKHNITDKDGEKYYTALCRGDESSDQDQYWTWDIGGQYSKLTAVQIVKESDKTLPGRAKYAIYGDEKKLKDGFISSNEESQKVEVPLTGVNKLKIQIWSESEWSESENQGECIESILADIRLHK